MTEERFDGTCGDPGCCSLEKTETMIEIGGKEYPIRRCKRCSEGFGAGHEFWSAFEIYIRKVDQCESEACCCKCRLLDAQVDFKARCVIGRCCIFPLNDGLIRWVDHGICPKFETPAMFEAKRKKRNEARNRTKEQRKEV